MIFLQRHIQRFVLPVIIFFTVQGTLVAQPDFKYKFFARVIDAGSLKAIKDCHIINKTQHKGTVSNENGQFTITANVKDSIEFSVIGYEKLLIAVHDSMYNNAQVIRLKPAIYPLSEVNVGLLSTYSQFKRDVMDTRVEPLSFETKPLVSKFEVYTKPLPNQGGINIPGLGSPVTYFYNLLSKEGKQQRYYVKLINGTADHIVVGNKFNGFVVKQLTGLEDDELIEFMSFCMFSKEYLLNASQEEINQAILWRFKDYIKSKQP